MMKTFCLDDGVLVTLRGPLPDEQLRATVASDTSTTNPNLVCWCKAPSDQNDRGFRRLVARPHFSRDSALPDEFAEGVLLTEPNSVAFIRTADCPTVVLYERLTHGQVITHAGRAAMTPRMYGSSFKNIVEYAYYLVTLACVREGWHPQVSAYITGAICANHFAHDRPKAWSLIALFLEEYGNRAVTDQKQGTLDLPWVITTELMTLGVQEENITHDGLCTFEKDDLASHRRDGDGRRNVIAATLMPRN